MNDWIIILGVAPFLIGMGGKVARDLVLNKSSKKELKGWRWLYKTTLPLHAMAVGSVLGFSAPKLGLPIPEVFGTEIGGYLLAYTLSGGVAVIGYDSIVKTLRSVIEAYRNPSKSE
jgi:hypothetical protein